MGYWNQFEPDRQTPGTAGVTRPIPGIPGTTGTGTVGPMAAPTAGSSTGLPPGYSLTGANSLASFSAPGLAAPWTQQFQAPDPNTIRADPSYQFQLGEGQNAIERSAASKGTLLTGGTLKDLTSWGQGLASTFDDKYYDRAMGEYGMDRGTFWGNQDNAYDRLSGMASGGAGAATSYANNMGNLYAQGANAQAQTGLAQNQAWNNTFGTLADFATDAARKRWGRRTMPNGSNQPFVPPSGDEFSY